MALYQDEFRKLFRNRPKVCLVAAAIVVLLAVFFLYGPLWPAMTVRLPSLALACLRECGGVVCAISVLVWFGFAGQEHRQSMLLHLLGKYSYEILLLHGVLLIRHNFAMRSSKAPVLIVEFYFLCVVVVALAVALSKVAELVNAKAGRRR